MRQFSWSCYGMIEARTGRWVSYTEHALAIQHERDKLERIIATVRSVDDWPAEVKGEVLDRIVKIAEEGDK